MAITLNASATPAQAPVGSLVNPQAVLDGDASPVVAPLVSSGDLDWPDKINGLGAMLDAAALALGPGIVSGLTPTVSGSSLNVTIADGVAFLNGIKAIKSLAAYTVPASQARVWLYLKQDGTLTHATNTTPPAGVALLLCSFATDGSGVTGSVDYSAVMYLRSGLIWRETADAGAPGDTLAANLRVWTKTAGGLYLWTGAAHVAIA